MVLVGHAGDAVEALSALRRVWPDITLDSPDAVAATTRVAAALGFFEQHKMNNDPSRGSPRWCSWARARSSSRCNPGDVGPGGSPWRE